MLRITKYIRTSRGKNERVNLCLRPAANKKSISAEILNEDLNEWCPAAAKNTGKKVNEAAPEGAWPPAQDLGFKNTWINKPKRTRKCLEEKEWQKIAIFRA